MTAIFLTDASIDLLSESLVFLEPSKDAMDAQVASQARAEGRAER